MLERLTTPITERFAGFRSRRAKEQDPLERLFLEANPNPNRIGCPGTLVLNELASRKFPIESPAEDHLAECSPCFEEYLELRQEYEGRQRRTTGLMVAAVAAAALALFLLMSQYWRTPNKVSDKVYTAKNNPPHPIGRLDYRVQERQNAPPESLAVVSSAAKELQIVLPEGSKAGDYALEISAAVARGSQVEQYKGKASPEKGGAIRLSAPVDFSSLPKGSYEVRWRRTGSESWDAGTFLVQ